MARPKKQGLDYFPMDVDFDQDPKLAMVIAAYGYKAELITIQLLRYLYKNYGYFLPWNEGEQLMFAKRVAYIGGSGVNLNNEVVGALVRWDFFSIVRSNSSQFLTSVEIQRTWLEATRKRKDRIIEPDIWLLNENKTPEQIELTPEQTSNELLFPSVTPLISPEMPQSKVKESKEEINKENLVNQGATFWERERSAFLTNQLFFEKFCMARRLPAATVRRLQEYFVESVELKAEIKEASELQRHFVNWFDRGQREQNIDQEGNLKNAPAAQTSKTVRNAIESETASILDLFDKPGLRQGSA